MPYSTYADSVTRHQPQAQIEITTNRSPRQSDVVDPLMRTSKSPLDIFHTRQINEDNIRLLDTPSPNSSLRGIFQQAWVEEHVQSTTSQQFRHVNFQQLHSSRHRSRSLSPCSGGRRFPHTSGNGVEELNKDDCHVPAEYLDGAQLPKYEEAIKSGTGVPSTTSSDVSTTITSNVVVRVCEVGSVDSSNTLRHSEVQPHGADTTYCFQCGLPTCTGECYPVR